MRRKEVKGGEEAKTQSDLEGEDEWEDILTEEEDVAAGREATEEDKPKAKKVGRPTSTVSPGRLGGRGQRGYWVKKREAKLRGRTKSSEGGADGQNK